MPPTLLATSLSAGSNRLVVGWRGGQQRLASSWFHLHFEEVHFGAGRTSANSLVMCCLATGGRRLLVSTVWADDASFTLFNLHKTQYSKFQWVPPRLLGNVMFDQILKTSSNLLPWVSMGPQRSREAMTWRHELMHWQKKVCKIDLVPKTKTIHKLCLCQKESNDLIYTEL